MKILLDECLPSDFRHSLSGEEAHSAEWAGTRGLSNGELLRVAEAAGYTVLLTVDKGIPHQQNATRRRLAIIVLRARSNRLPDLTPFVVAILEALKRIQHGDVIVLPPID
jgi:predicted nuclease of predicted toxin-antitoxin system